MPTQAQKEQFIRMNDAAARQRLEADRALSMEARLEEGIRLSEFLDEIKRNLGRGNVSTG